MKPLTIALLALVTLQVSHNAAIAESAAQAYQRGEQLLLDGQFRDALTQFATAVQADRQNREYASRYMMVRRIIRLRQQFETEKDNDRLAYLAGALRQFYLGHDLFGEALALDKKMYERVGDTRAALALADSQLAAGQNQQAADVLASIPEGDQNNFTRALRAIALSRLGRTDEAARLAAQVQVSSEAGLGVLYAVARMHAATGNQQQALSALERFFESVPPSQQAGFRETARTCPEFASLAGSPPFQAALATKSKVSESKCSGGKSCAGCPMRGNCPGSK